MAESKMLILWMRFFAVSSILSSIVAAPIPENVVELKFEVSDKPFIGTVHGVADSGKDVHLICLHRGYLPSELSWYHGDEKLEAEDCSGPYLSCRKLILSSVTLESSGNLYTCRGTELKEISWATGQIYVNRASQPNLEVTSLPGNAAANHPTWQLLALFVLVHLTSYFYTQALGGCSQSGINQGGKNRFACIGETNSYS